jgi:acyl-CoA hydrolase
LWKRGRIKLDVALLSVSPPDTHGMLSLGTSVDVSVSAMQSAKRVIALVNNHVPRSQGDGAISAKRIHNFVELNAPLLGHEAAQIRDTEK